MTTAGETLRRFRELAELSQEDVATALEVSPGAVSQWENGRTAPTRARAVRADALLKAGGEVAAAWGYARVDITETDHLARIERRLDLMEEQISQLLAGGEVPPAPPTSE